MDITVYVVHQATPNQCINMKTLHRVGGGGDTYRCTGWSLYKICVPLCHVQAHVDSNYTMC